MPIQLSDFSVKPLLGSLDPSYSKPHSKWCNIWQIISLFKRHTCFFEFIRPRLKVSRCSLIGGLGEPLQVKSFWKIWSWFGLVWFGLPKDPSRGTPYKFEKLLNRYTVEEEAGQLWNAVIFSSKEYLWSSPKGEREDSVLSWKGWIILRGDIEATEGMTQNEVN